MGARTVSEVMVPLDDVPTINQDATVAEAVRELERAQQQGPRGRLPFRVVLVTDDRGRIVGKLGHLAFLQALKPGYESREEHQALERAGVDPVLADSLSRYKRFWEHDLEASCQRAARLRVREVMRPLQESIDAEASIVDAISTLIQLGSLSILVRSSDEIVGLLRLADLYEVAAGLIADPG
jgi:CBS domain-containing protein